MAVHPRHLLAPDIDEWFLVWEGCRDGKSLPDPGGYLQQSAKLMDAFSVMENTAQALVKARKTRFGKP